MTESPRRGVTRGYVGGIIAATTIFTVALVVSSWGLLGLAIGRPPVTTPGVWILAAEAIVCLLLAMLAWGMWSQALSLLRGRRSLSWSHAIALAGGAYLVWCLAATLAGMDMRDTWLSPFALTLAVIWALCSLIFWGVLARKVYTDRPVPQWPWERKGEPGPDWMSFPGTDSEPNAGDDPYADGASDADGERR